MDFPYELNAHMSGLRQGRRVPPNTEALEYAKNTRITRSGCELPVFPSQPDGAAFSYPHPLLVRLDRGDLRLGSSSIAFRSGRSGTFGALSTWDPNDSLTQSPFTSSSPWQCVSANTIWFASDGENFLYFAPDTGGKVYNCSISVHALGMVGRRLFISCTGEWFESSRWQNVIKTWRRNQPKGRFAHEDMEWDGSWIVALEPGGGADDIPYHIGMAALGVYGTERFDYWKSFIDTYLEEGDITLIPSERSSDVRFIQPLGSDGLVLVGGVDSVSVLRPDGYRYTEKTLIDVGVAGRCAVARGSDGACLFVDSQGYVCLTSPAGDLRRLDYSEFIPLDGELLVSHDPVTEDYWITDGSESYIFSTGLAGPVDVCPTSLVRDAAAGLIGYASGASQSSYNVEIRFHETNFGVADMARVMGVVYNCVNLSNVEWRIDSRLGPNDDWVIGPWIPSFNDNFANPAMAGVLLRLSVRGVTTKAEPFLLSGAEVRYFGSGSNVRRGPEPGFGDRSGR